MFHGPTIDFKEQTLEIELSLILGQTKLLSIHHTAQINKYINFTIN